ncbi:MAG: ParA family protein [Chloroflexota bacterium]|nr:ParA family protein [Chloroflexota bacterium]
MVVVAVANQKGGVGKTTTAVTLAHGLALKNYGVLLVDLDPQGQCASHLGMEQEDGVFNLLVGRPVLRDVVRGTGRGNLWLLPGSKRTKTAETLMAIEGRGVDTLGGVLETAINGSRLHFVVLDTAPSAGGLQENALFAADLLVVPAAVDYLSLEGVAELLKTLGAVGRVPPPVVRVLPTFYDGVTRESRVNLERLTGAFGERALKPIHRAAVLRECPALGQTIFEHDGGCRAAREYGAVVWEVLDGTR